MRIKIASLFLCLILMVSVFVGCGAQKEEATAEDETTQNVQADTSSKEATNNSESTTVTEKKKIIFVQEDDLYVREDQKKNFIASMEKNGYVNGKTADITVINLQGDSKKAPDVVKQITDAKPDLVVTGDGAFIESSVTRNLKGTGIPVITCISIETPDAGYIDLDGKPKGNVTGIYTMQKDLAVSAYQLLQKISPTNGKKAVFITTVGFFKKEDVANNLKQVGVELKDYIETKYLEDWQDAIKKYNNDNEVAWELIGVGVTQKKDGSSINILDTIKWDLANRKKPTITFWESAVQVGYECALGVDIPENGNVAAELGVKILKGEKVENINAVYPRKTAIILNQKRAKDMGLQFPTDILGSASKVYDSTINDAK